MRETSVNNNEGFTLAEVMVAILIMMVGMLGLLEAVNATIGHNLKNKLREEAVYLGQKYMDELRGQSFDLLSSSYTPFQVKSAMQGGGRTYSVERRVQDLAIDTTVIPNQVTSRQLEVVIKWGYKNITSQNRVLSVRAR